MDKKLASNRICFYLAEGECEEKLIREYPVFEGETEEEARNRAIREGQQ